MRHRERARVPEFPRALARTAQLPDKGARGVEDGDPVSPGVCHVHPLRYRIGRDAPRQGGERVVRGREFGQWNELSRKRVVGGTVLDDGDASGIAAEGVVRAVGLIARTGRAREQGGEEDAGEGPANPHDPGLAEQRTRCFED